MPNDASISDEHYRIHGFCAANRSTSLPLLFIWFFFTFFFFVIIASLIILIIIIQNKSRPNERWLIDVFTQSILQFFICVWSRCTKSSLLLHLLFIFFCAVYILSLCDFWRIVQRLIIITIRSIYIFSWFPDYGTSSSSICDNDELVNIENIFCFCCFVSSFFWFESKTSSPQNIIHYNHHHHFTRWCVATCSLLMIRICHRAKSLLQFTFKMRIRSTFLSRLVVLVQFGQICILFRSFISDIGCFRHLIASHNFKILRTLSLKGF